MCRFERLVGLFLAATLTIALSASAAHADPVKCLAGIGKASASFAQAKMKLLQKCAEGFAKKGLPAACPDQKTADKITATEAKASASVVKVCGGKDKACGTGDDDTLASINWPSTCMNFESGSCNGAIADCSGIGPCLTCIGEAAVDQAVGLYYGSLAPNDPKTNKALNKCQLAIGKSAAAFFAAKTKALQKCWDTQNKNGAKGNPTAACPPFGPDEKTDAAIAKALAKTDAAICKACGGADKLCDGNADITPAEIGFPGSCPPVTVPGTSTQACAGTVTTLDDLRKCVDCVTEFKADCVTLAGATGFPSAPAYPSECNPVLPATPTRTATPVVTATPTSTGGGGATATPTATSTGGGATATPTATSTGGGVTPTPTVTSTPGSGAVCGNGIVEAGEDCDTAGGAANSCFTASNTSSLFTCDAVTCQCACPTKVEFVGTSGNLGVLDSGWTGQGHDATVVSDGKVTVAVTSCAGGTSRPCGICSVSGPIQNVNADAGDINPRRCTGNTRTKCSTNADCSSAGGTCEFYFGSPLPLAAGGVSTCVTNQINGSVTGTLNAETGSAATTAALISRVYSGPTSAGPCPKCVGDGASNDNNRAGTCDSGQNAGQTCDVNGTSPNPFWKSTSLDCPPLSGGLIATLPIDLTNSTGTRTKTLSAASPNCRAIGFTTNKCLCDTCNNGSSTPCSANADCAASGRCTGGSGTFCVGGTNAGASCTVASQCPSGSCRATGGAPCTSSAQCFGGGTCSGRPCTVGTQCDSGTCTSGFCSTTAGICGGTNGQRCTGGTNAGAPCSLATQCPGGACNVPGQATAPNQCDDATCSPDTGNEGTCAAGPFEQFCGPNATFQGCKQDSECAQYNACTGGANAGADCTQDSECPGGTCNSEVGGTPEVCAAGKFRNCFVDNGTVGGGVTATGAVDAPVHDEADPTLAALFCIGPTSSSGVNGAAGLPGLGRLELPGHAKGLP